MNEQAFAVKRLPRKPNGDFKPTFMVGDRKFTIRSQSEGIGIDRYSQLMAMTAVLAYQSDFAHMERNFAKLESLLNDWARGKNTLLDIASHVNQMRRGLIDTNERSFDLSFWVCTLFVWDENEPPRWNDHDQQGKIECWRDAGFHEMDFYLLAKKKLVEFSTPSDGLNLTASTDAATAPANGET